MVVIDIPEDIFIHDRIDILIYDSSHSKIVCTELDNDFIPKMVMKKECAS